MAMIDINCDMGEGFGVYALGDDAEMLKVVTSANIACGFHAGDPLVMHRTLKGAKDNGVGVGAHPGFLDLWGFGRRPIHGERLGLPLVREVYADRAYADNGNLVSRKLPGAVLHAPDAVAERVVRMLGDGAITCASGARLPTRIDSVCVHGDTPGAVSMARRLREKLTLGGIKLAPMADVIGL